MHPFARLLAWTAMGLAGLFVSYVLLLWTEWLPRLTENEERALTLLSRPPESVPAEDNAFFDFWTINYALDANQRAAAATSELHRVNAEIARDAEEIAEFSGPPANLDGVPANASSILCGNDTRCLNHVSGAFELVSQLLDHSRALQLRTRGALQRTALRNPFSLTAQTPTNNQNLARSIRLLQTASAWEFLSGNRTGAIDGVCQAADQLRSLRATSNSLAASVQLDRLIGNYAALYIDMIRSIDFRETPDASCRAWRPLASTEIVQCDVWKTEYEWMREGADVARSHLLEQKRTGRVLAELGTNRKHTNARIAAYLARYCEADVAQLAAAGRVIDRWSLQNEMRCSRTDRLFNPLGCYMLDPADGETQANMFNSAPDLEAQLTLTRTIERRFFESERADDPSNDGGPRLLEVLSSSLPKTYPARFSRILRSIEIPVHSRGETWSLPLDRKLVGHRARQR